MKKELSGNANQRLGLIGILVWFVIGTLAVLTVNYLMRAQALEEAHEKALIMIERNLSIHAFINQQQKPLLLEAFRSQIQAGYFEPSWMSSTFIVRRVEEEYKQRSAEKYYYREAAINARSPKNEADSFERDFLLRANRDPHLVEQTEIRVINGDPYFQVIRRGESLEPDCLRCHSTPEEAPKGLVEYYGPVRSFNRQSGDLVSAISVRIPLAEAYQKVTQLSFKLSGLIFLGLGLLYLIQNRLVKFYFSDPLENLAKEVSVIADRPLELGQQVAPQGTDELKPLIKGFNRLSSRVAESQKELAENNRRLFRQMEELDQAHLELKTFSQRFQELASHLPGVVVQFGQDHKGQLSGLFVSEQVTPFYHKTLSEVMNNPLSLFDHLHLEDKAYFIRTFERAGVTGESFSVEHRILGPSPKWMRADFSAKVVEQGHLLWNGVMVEISAAKELEAQLRKAEQIAQRASEAKSGFLTAMSHEIRTPLNAMLGFADLLAPGIPDGPLRSYMVAIQASGKALTNLIGDILDLGQIEAGQLVLRREPVSLPALFEEIKQVFSLELEKKGLYLNIEIDPAINDLLMLDRSRFYQILYHLIGNAVKFTQEGGVRLTISNVKSRGGRAEFCLSIEDSGPGIEAHRLLSLIGQEEPKEGAGMPPVEAPGLGLAIIRKLVEAHGGELEINSELGQGTKVSLHMAHVVKVPSTKGPWSKNQQDWSKVQFAPAKVLVVDDMEINRLLLVEYFKDSGLIPLEAGDGQEAIEVTKREKPQLVLMDLRMPMMSGDEAAMRLKADPETSRIPILALTASASVTKISEFKAMGFDGYLTKPIDINSLFETMAHYLAHAPLKS
ncbi:MAG: hypothetical protein A2508_07290 [Candidatus Lambdaproteobacteria bacterium RIFOXYD12_FULL_49_8]|uniref:histidine kinase n=1 Tax=Candidatus Lambdaproteobacteria bacterium RIFOXYD2_FULL_50_16 TaxID=1817772 RepID=A0A1F6GG14_9PROT|nr:MAG: hypothetical protein A2527_03060 [Candidatus Lambdaproteobacteria bacterium RIFOXYD2_FULL_50_16]OGG98220.1 MAG: hypothetical protein A2508_07290 [Candidatus Lambdaproteobacteria bacterium RIFOXYD12_FULL_49_8]